MTVLLGLTKAEEHRTISILTEISTWATLAGTIFIIVSYLAFKELRHFHLRLVFFLAITDFFVSITFILNLHIDLTQNVSCEILGAFLQFFELASALWAFCIAFVLDQVIRLNNYNVERLEKYFHVLCWTLPLGTIIASHFQGLFSNTGLWCWLGEKDRELYRWLYFYGPLVLILVYVVVIYITISQKIRAQIRLSANVYAANNETTIQQTFRWYIIGWIICWVPAIMDRVQGMVQPDSPVYVLSALHAFFAPLAGFCNSVAIGFNDEIQAQYSVCYERKREERRKREIELKKEKREAIIRNEARENRTKKRERKKEIRGLTSMQAVFRQLGVNRSQQYIVGKMKGTVQDRETKIIQEYLKEYDENED